MSTPRKPTTRPEKQQPMFTSAADDKLFYESTMRSIDSMTKYLTAAMAEHAPSSAFAKRLKTKYGEISVLRAEAVRCLDDACRTLAGIRIRFEKEEAAAKKKAS